MNWFGPMVMNAGGSHISCRRPERSDPMATAPKFRIDVDIHNLLMDSSREPVRPAAVKGMSLPEPVFPQYPEKLADPGPEIPLEKRDWRLSQIYRAMRGWLFPY